MDTPRRTVELSLRKAQQIIGARADELGRLDAAAGDGDHGTTMVRGLRAANQAVEGMEDDASPGQVLLIAGSAFADAAGGAAGALFGMFLLTAGQQLGDGPFDVEHVHAALHTALTTASQMGNAQVGDKTFIDTLSPFVEALGNTAGADSDLTSAWRAALVAAEEGAASTAGMVARKGRSARLGERSREGLDPGAVSMCYLLQAAGEALDETCKPE